MRAMTTVDYGSGRTEPMPDSAVPPPPDLWPHICAQLHKELGESATREWLPHTQLERIDGCEAVLSLPTKYILNSVRARFGSDIRAKIIRHLPEIESVTLVVKADERPSSPPGWKTAPAHSPTSPDRFIFDSELTFDNFLCCDSNRLAHQCASEFARFSSPPAFNPLFLHSPVGAGKTHLLYAIGQQFQMQHPEARILALSAEQFTHRFVRALRDNTPMAFKEQLRSVDLLLVDDVQFLNGKSGIELEFLHTLNELITKGRRVAVTADRAPGDIEGFSPRIRSLLAGGLVAAISTASGGLRLDFLRAQVTQAQSRHPGLECADTALKFLAEQLPTNLRELNGAINRLVAEALLIQAPITKELAEDRLQDILRASRRRPTADSIRKFVANYYDLRESDLTSKSRRRETARPRQIAMYLTRRFTDSSLAEIGAAYGKRDHSTVLYAARKIEALRGTNPALDDQIREMERIFGG